MTVLYFEKSQNIFVLYPNLSLRFYIYNSEKSTLLQVYEAHLTGKNAKMRVTIPKHYKLSFEDFHA